MRVNVDEPSLFCDPCHCPFVTQQEVDVPRLLAHCASEHQRWFVVMTRMTLRDNRLAQKGVGRCLARDKLFV
jgi:hypothetical protein